MRLLLLEQLILEDKIDYLETQLGDKLLAAAKADTFYYKEDITARDVLDRLQTADINNQYLQWIARQYANKDFRIEDLNRVKTALEQFVAKKNNLPSKDIGQYKRLSDLEIAIENTEDFKTKNQKIEQAKVDGATVIVDGPDAKIVRLDTIEAAKAYGKDGNRTMWCTASEEKNMFDRYNSKGPLYVVLGKDGRKFQLHPATEQYMDNRDDPVDIDELAEVYPSIFKIDGFHKPEIIQLTNGGTHEMQFNGTEIWRNRRGELHREAGPAAIHLSGEEMWYQNDQLHRDDGPAYIGPAGDEFWYQNNKIHRDNGPAVTYSDGTQAWYNYSNLHRDDGPAVIAPDGYKAWYQNGKFHRDNGPAVIHQDGTKKYYQHGRMHRENGPAIEYSNGFNEFWLDGKQINPPTQGLTNV